MRALAPVVGMLSLGCQALADPHLDYVDCIPSPDGKYVETFDRALPPAARCWKTENAEEPGYVQENDGDLFIHPIEDPASRWYEMEPAAFVFQEVTGDFLAVARVEAVSSGVDGDHCLDESEAAGLVVRRRDPFAWTNLLVRPDLDRDQLKDPVYCGDDPVNPTFAKVTTDSFGFGASTELTMTGRGSDGEADVAVCRKDDQLFYFVQEFEARADDPVPPNLEARFVQVEIGYGPVDVGLTATAASETSTLPEGHFNWLFLQDYGKTKPESCLTALLEEFVYPEDE